LNDICLFANKIKISDKSNNGQLLTRERQQCIMKSLICKIKFTLRKQQSTTPITLQGGASQTLIVFMKENKLLKIREEDIRVDSIRARLK